MEVIGFLCVSLGSSTVRLHESLGSRGARACSEAGFRSQNGDCAWWVYYQRAALLRFLLWVKGLDAKKIHNEIFPSYSGKWLSRKAVHNWVEKFSQGRSKVADDARPHHPVEIVTEATVQRAEQLIWADRRIAIDSVATALGCSHGLAFSIMHDCLKSWKVCSQWVPRELKDQGKMNCMGLSLQHLLW
jgi:hypothetical protein